MKKTRFFFGSFLISLQGCLGNNMIEIFKDNFIIIIIIINKEKRKIITLKKRNEKVTKDDHHDHDGY